MRPLCRILNRHGKTWRAVIALCACSPPGEKVASLPCVIALEEGGIALRSDPSISLSESATRIIRDSKGNFFGSASLGGQVLKWGPDGTLLAAIGRPGDGPGELGSSAVSVFVVADSLYIADSHRHWAVYDPDLHLVRYSPLGPIGANSPYDTHFISGSGIISTDPTSDIPDDGIVMLTRQGEVVRSFAPMDNSDAPWRPHQRPSAYVGEGQLWVAPVAGPRDGYRIEIWDTAGILVDSIVRDVPWFPAQRDYSPARAREEGKAPFVFPSLSTLFADASGKVWAISAIPNRDDAATVVQSADIREYARVLDTVLDYRVEVFDIKTRRLLSTTTLPRSPLRFWGPLFSGRYVRLTREDSSGTVINIASRFRLHDTSGAECAQ